MELLLILELSLTGGWTVVWWCCSLPEIVFMPVLSTLGIIVVVRRWLDLHPFDRKCYSYIFIRILLFHVHNSVCITGIMYFQPNLLGLLGIALLVWGPWAGWEWMHLPHLKWSVAPCDTSSCRGCRVRFTSCAPHCRLGHSQCVDCTEGGPGASSRGVFPGPEEVWPAVCLLCHGKIVRKSVLEYVLESILDG